MKLRISRIASRIIAIFLFLGIPALSSTAFAANTKFSWDVPVQNLQIYQESVWPETTNSMVGSNKPESKPGPRIILTWQTHPSGTNEGSFAIIIAEDEPISLEYLQKNPWPNHTLWKSGGYGIDIRGKTYFRKLRYPFQAGHTYYIGVATADDEGKLIKVTRAINHQQKIVYQAPEAESTIDPSSDDPELSPKDQPELIDGEAGLFAMGPTQAPWKDTAGSPWETGINYLFLKGITPEYANPDLMYKPDAPVTRYELIMMMLRHKYGLRVGGNNKNPKTACGYKDLKTWWTKEGKTTVCFAKKEFHLKKLTHGVSRFEPDKAINLVEALTVLVPYLFEDFDVNAELSEYVRRAADEGLIPRTVETLYSELRRGELADMLARAYYIKEKAVRDYDLLAKTADTFMTYECLKLGTCPVLVPAEAEDETPTIPQVQKWAVVFTYREQPFSKYKVRQLCTKLLPQVPKWFNKEAEKNGANYFKLELTCLQKQLKLPEELDTMHFTVPAGENDGSFIERPLSLWSVGEFTQKPPYDRYDYVTFLHYIPYEYSTQPTKDIDARTHALIVQQLDQRETYYPAVKDIPTLLAQSLARTMGASDILVPTVDDSCQDLMCAEKNRYWDRFVRRPLKSLRITEETAKALGW